MKSRRIILLFWALFLVPALILALVAFQLLSHEQDRISRATVNAMADRARAVCETLHLTMETVQDRMTRSLLDIEPGHEQQVLAKWEKTNPLVRNVFIFLKGRGLDYPPPGKASTPEEQQFKNRYDALFSGRIPFDFNKTGIGTEKGTEGPATATRGSGSYGSLKEKQEAPSQRALVSLSQSIETHAGKVEGKEDRDGGSFGWIPWFSENRLYILGWVRPRSRGPVYGVELEWMTILSRMVVDFPKLTRKGTALVLLDGSGEVVHRTGPLAVESSHKPVMEVPVSSLLPHWRIGIYLDENMTGTGKLFFYVSMMLLGVLITAMVAAGVLLTRLASQKIRDARQKTSFVSSVSHELKTPLTSIRMYAELLLSGRVGDGEKKTTYLRVIVNESARLTRLINNVLDFGKLEQKTKTYRVTDFEMDEFLEGLIHAHGIRIREAGLEIVKEIAPGNYRVRSDRDALEQVVLNLVDNALKYAGSGRFLKFVLEPSDAGALLKIQDDGPGIQREDQEKIFEKFFRADNSLTSAQPGSGLGLSISRRILRDLGGDLVLEPGDGKGACFSMEINHAD
ncbi:sensor histidine kinase [Desulfospira joergensenii]|uniref:sensor histidine kinase n=1 Tax=Desulfospira joergensenii TaxID=53329 RepID=UPI0003B463D4|nr:HAMP domain-containing sensor histidine kinase [Desulfospira joergensenii]